jgi:hypothetical protein
LSVGMPRTPGLWFAPSPTVTRYTGWCSPLAVGVGVSGNCRTCPCRGSGRSCSGSRRRTSAPSLLSSAPATGSSGPTGPSTTASRRRMATRPRRPVTTGGEFTTAEGIRREVTEADVAVLRAGLAETVPERSRAPLPAAPPASTPTPLTSISPSGLSRAPPGTRWRRGSPGTGSSSPGGGRSPG